MMHQPATDNRHLVSVPGDDGHDDREGGDDHTEAGESGGNQPAGGPEDSLLGNGMGAGEGLFSL